MVPKYALSISLHNTTAASDAQVIINGRREDVLKATAEELNVAAKEAGMGGEVIPVQGDVATKAGIVEFYDKASKHLDQVGRCNYRAWDLLTRAQLDFLVNNAGFSSNWKVQTKMVGSVPIHRDPG